tara:strand:+ start:1783 stop:2130 length:348 start_codon:yes stop_codon:yes gene_type:complete
MSHFFCHSCGFKIEYSRVKPNFCSKCGQQLGVSTASNTNTLSDPVLDDLDLKDDETRSESVPNISKIQVEYSLEGFKTHTLGSLAGEPPNVGGRKPRSKSVNEFLDEKRSEKENI